MMVNLSKDRPNSAQSPLQTEYNLKMEDHKNLFNIQVLQGFAQKALYLSQVLLLLRPRNYSGRLL